MGGPPGEGRQCSGCIFRSLMVELIKGAFWGSLFVWTCPKKFRSANIWPHITWSRGDPSNVSADRVSILKIEAFEVIPFVQQVICRIFDLLQMLAMPMALVSNLNILLFNFARMDGCKPSAVFKNYFTYFCRIT